MEDKKRSANFTKSEIDLLVDIVLEKKDIIENKKSDSMCWADKAKAWNEITDEFNAYSDNILRSSKTVRGKYDSLKKDLRRKCTKLKGINIKFEPYEKKILESTNLFVDGIKYSSDNDNENDSRPKRQFSQVQTDLNKKQIQQTDLIQKRIQQTDLNKTENHQADVDKTKEIQELEKIFLKQKIQQRAEIHRLEVEKLKLEIEIRQAELEKLNANE